MIDYKKRIQSSSLLITVVIALIISILLTSLIYLAFHSRVEQTAYFAEKRLKRNISSGIVLALEKSSDRFIEKTDTIDLFGEGYDTLIVRQKNWGLFGVAFVKAVKDKRALSRVFMHGAILPKCFQAGIYLVDHQRPLALVGFTRLNGDLYLPRSGLQKAIIGDKSYEGNHLNLGIVKVSDSISLPLDETVVEYLKKLRQGVNLSEMELIDLSDSMSQSFKSDVLRIHRKEPIILNSCMLSGQILLMSDTLVDIESSASLENVIIIAPSVRFREGFKGVVQVIASDSIIVDANCRFDYPSALALFRDAESGLSTIYIGKDVRIEGSVLSIAKETDLGKNFVTIEASSTVTGVVYVNGFLQCKANIEGLVITDYFLYRTTTGIFENYLVDFEIDRSKLPSFFVFPTIFKGSSKNDIVQWLE